MRTDRICESHGRGVNMARFVRQAAFTCALVVILWFWQANFALASTQRDVNEEINCLALTIYFEARGEHDRAKRAVAHVVMNRVANPGYPSSVCGVVRQGGEIPRFRCQFTWWCDGLSDRPREIRAWKQARDFARYVFWGAWDDLTNGALWYHADYVSPYWRSALKRGPKIGRHIFYLQPSEPNPTSVQTAETAGN